MKHLSKPVMGVKIVNMTVDNFRLARSSKSNTSDHIVFVRKHKVRSNFCKINLYAKLFDAATKYISCFADKYLNVVGKHGRMFPQVSHNNGPVPMEPSLYNKRIRSVWAQYARTRCIRCFAVGTSIMKLTFYCLHVILLNFYSARDKLLPIVLFCIQRSCANCQLMNAGLAIQLVA